jgi:nitrile hydratase
MTARFRPGDQVRVRGGFPPGHIRTPIYLRGHPGVVHRLLGEFGNPEDLAFGGTGLPRQPLYQVLFEQGRLWPEPEAGRGSLIADIYEHWLEPA